MHGISGGSPDPTAVPPPAPGPEDLTRVVALDGPAGSGKSTVAARVADVLGWRFVDTGATYRAATLAAMRSGADLADPEAVTRAVLRSSIEPGIAPGQPCVRLDGEDVSAEIRGPEVTARVSAVSAIPEVREHLIAVQRRAMGTTGAVVEGRDIATVVAPRALVKVYLDARPEVRARRRAGESPSGGPELASAARRDLEPQMSAVQEALLARDAADALTNPLRATDGAVHLDTSDLTLDEVVDAVVEMAREAACAPASPSTWATARGERRGWLVAASRPFGRALFGALFRLSVTGQHHVPARGPVLLAGNHTGFLDGPLVYAVSPRPASFLAKAELFAGPVARPLGWLGQIPVHRGRPDRAALRTGLRVLQAGGALGVFPEGTRGSGELARVNDGIAYLALRSGAPIVPVAVLGTSAALPKGSRAPRWRAPVSVVFGRPFTVAPEGDPRARSTVRGAAEQIRLALQAHLHESSATSGHASLRSEPSRPAAGPDGDGGAP